MFIGSVGEGVFLLASLSSIRVSALRLRLWGEGGGFWGGSSSVSEGFRRVMCFSEKLDWPVFFLCIRFS